MLLERDSFEDLEFNHGLGRERGQDGRVAA